MRKAVAFVSAFCATVCCMSSLVACDDTPTVTIGYTEYPPMNYVDDKGKLVGFDTELAKKVFGDLGYRVRFKLIEWDHKYEELSGGTVDCLWNGFTANVADADGVQRSDKVDFSYNYMTNAQCIVRHANGTEATSTTMLEGCSIAYEIGSAGESYVKKLTGINDKGVSDQMTALLEVKSGTADYAVVDLLLAQSVADSSSWANVVINQGITIDAEYYAVGFKKGSKLTEKVNGKLVSLSESGYLATLAERYGLATQVITDYSDQIK